MNGFRPALAAAALAIAVFTGGATVSSEAKAEARVTADPLSTPQELSHRLRRPVVIVAPRPVFRPFRPRIVRIVLH